MIEWVDLFVTDSCNLMCRYCFHRTGGNILSADRAIEFIDDLSGEMSDNCIINFFGGEPLLNMESILAVVSHVKSSGKRYKFSISTNGTIFDRDFFMFMKENNFSLQVSFDGDKETQNKYRGEYDLISSNIKKILDLGMEISVRMTYDPTSIDSLSINMKHIHSLGIKNIMHQPVIESQWDDASVGKYCKQYSEMSCFYKSNYNCKSTFFDKSKLSRRTSLNDPTCKAGKTLVAVDVDGSVYPCHRFASNKNCKLGNTKLFHRGIFSKITRKNMDNCFPCEAKQTCHMCMAANLEINGSISETVPGYCDLIRMEYDLLKKDVELSRGSVMDRIEEKIDNLMSLLINLCNVELERCKKNG